MTTEAQNANKIKERQRLRDEFAMAALTGIISATHAETRQAQGSRRDVDWTAYYADAAYNVANAMLAARKKK
ncbi:MAG: hypothetical protein AAFX54_02935 [Pseudomonadota bacterium]